VLGAIVASSGSWQFMNVRQQVGYLVAAGDNVTRGLEVNRLAEAMHRLALRFRSSGDMSAVKEFTDDAAHAKKLLDESMAATTSDERRQLYTEMQGEFNGIRQEFSMLVAVTQAIGDDRSDLLKGGETLTRATEAMLVKARTSLDDNLVSRAQDVENDMLRARVASWEFIATNDPKTGSAFKLALASAQISLKALNGANKVELIKDTFPDVQKALDAYGKSFGRILADADKASNLYDKILQEKLQKLRALGEQIQASLDADMKASRSGTDHTISTMAMAQLLLGGLGLLLGLAFAFFIGRGIAGPVSGMTRVMTRLAEGDREVVVPALDNKDEIGEMAHAVEVFKKGMIEAADLAAAQQAEHARKEERQQAIEEAIAAFDASIGQSLETLDAAAREMRATAEGMSATAEETSRQASAVSSASEQAWSNVQTVAAATEEMTSSIAEINRQVSQSTQIAAKAVEEAARTNVTMRGLAEAAQRIGEVVMLIQDIASQTNLLALNATIEAARAGEAGKGFAVVASEVKTLANQTGKATEEISSQIAAIQSATKSAVEAIKGIDGTIGQISEISTAIAAAIEEQGASTSEITRNTQETARGTEEVSRNIAGVSDAIGQTGAAASQVLASSTELGRQAETLRAEVGQFLAAIRAA
jgi:methyl-accepting chemotaxis protein